MLYFLFRNNHGQLDVPVQTLFIHFIVDLNRPFYLLLYYLPIIYLFIFILTLDGYIIDS